MNNNFFPGAETFVIKDLISSGAMKHFDFFYIDYHTKNPVFKDAKWKNRSQNIEDLLKQYNKVFAKPVIHPNDDEMYGYTQKPIQACSK